MTIAEVERLDLTNAVAQAKGDARAGEIPAVFHRRNREGWLVTMPLESWIELYREWDAGRWLEGRGKGYEAQHP